jgi:hypothetical protein
MMIYAPVIDILYSDVQYQASSRMPILCHSLILAIITQQNPETSVGELTPPGIGSGQQAVELVV